MKNIIGAGVCLLGILAGGVWADFQLRAYREERHIADRALAVDAVWRDGYEAGAAWQRAKYDELLDRAVALQRENERLSRNPPLVSVPWPGKPDSTVWAIPNLPPRGEPIGE